MIGSMLGYVASMWVLWEPAVVATSGGIAGFSQVESEIIYEARTILQSSNFKAIEQAYEAGKPVVVRIGGRIIQYEPGLPTEGISMFGKNGFVIGPKAFVSYLEVAKTVLHELYRLATSQSQVIGVTAELAAQETKAAYEFAERAVEFALK